MKEKDQFIVKWIDGNRFPQCVPDLRFPEGVDLDVTKDPDQPSCVCALPYPAKRCGWYYVECTKCKVNGMITTAGRFDDPRSIKMPCHFGHGKPSEIHIAPHSQE